MATHLDSLSTHPDWHLFPILIECSTAAMTALPCNREIRQVPSRNYERNTSPVRLARSRHTDCGRSRQSLAPLACRIDPDRCSVVHTGADNPTARTTALPYSRVQQSLQDTTNKEQGSRAVDLKLAIQGRPRHLLAPLAVACYIDPDTSTVVHTWAQVAGFADGQEGSSLRHSADHELQVHPVTALELSANSYEIKHVILLLMTNGSDSCPRSLESC